ncbi:MAG: murein L,D-transpeptidase [Bacteroidales bacterium]
MPHITYIRIYTLLFPILTLFAFNSNGNSENQNTADQYLAYNNRNYAYSIPDTLLPGHERVADPEKATYQDDSGGPGRLRWEDKDNIDELLSFIENSIEHGLDPEDYNFQEIKDLLEREGRIVLDVTTTEMLDSLLTDAYVTLAVHLSIGKADPEILEDEDFQWAGQRRKMETDPLEILRVALTGKKVKESLEGLAPGHREYVNLQNALVEFRQIKEGGGWEIPGDIPSLSKETEHPGVSAVRRRLGVTQGEIHFEEGRENYFDETLHEHVVLFQERNGIIVDGIVGGSTLEIMNIPVEERIEVIRANLERWRWLTEDFGDRYIEVDITAYELTVFDDNKPVLVSDVIVGRSDRPTPVLSETMTYLVVNPRWYIPPGIFAGDIVPGAANDTAYLDERDIVLLDDEQEKVDPDSVDWDGAAERVENDEDPEIPYQVVQEPGPETEMGRVKFMFPNPYHIYIHDSPHEILFDEEGRNLSSGCIRIGQPFDLLDYFLQDIPDWDMDKVYDTFGEEDEHEVALEDPIDVHVIYLTARADDDGVVYFREDIYDLDEKLLNALNGERSQGDFSLEN